MDAEVGPDGVGGEADLRRNKAEGRFAGGAESERAEEWHGKKDLIENPMKKNIFERGLNVPLRERFD